MNLQAGAGRVEIVPPVPTPLGGYPPVKLFSGGPEDHRGYIGRTGVSDGVQLPIYARALSLESSSGRALLIGLEVCMVSLAFATKAKARIAKAHGILADQIIIAASHTHSAPDYVGYWEPCDPQVEDFMLERIDAAVYQAVSSMRKARLALGEGNLSTPLVNRRDAERPVDPAVTVLSVLGEAGAPIAVLFVFACHPVVIGSMNHKISGDFPGYAAALVESALGQPAVALFLNGAAGNINPLAFPYTKRQNITVLSREYNLAGKTVDFRTHVDAKRLGTALGGEVLKVVALNEPSKMDAVRTWRESVSLVLKRDQALEDYFEHLCIEPVHQARWRGDTSTEVMAMRLGDLVLVAFPGEPFVEIGLEIQNREVSSQAQVRAIAYANDYPGYVIRPEDYEENRYETTATPLAREGASGIIDVARRLATTATRNLEPSQT